MQAVVLAAGKGTRMRSDTTKVLHPALGLPSVGHIHEILGSMKVSRACYVLGYGGSQVRSFIDQIAGKPRAVYALQREQKGTGHAVMQAVPLLNRSGEVLVWPGDMPLVKRSTLERFVKMHRQKKSRASVLSCRREDPHGYGRILRSGGRLVGIREELDASESERRIQEVNTGVYLFDGPTLFASLKQLRPNNRKREYYLTDVIQILVSRSICVEAFPLASAEEGQGINNRRDLARVIKVMNNREIRAHMDRGVTFVDPEAVYIEKGVRIGQDTVIYPWCYIEKQVRIGRHCQIGPFAKIRSGSVVGDRSVVGSFVEVTRSQLGKGVMAKHLSYLGDARVGDETNIGAGVITANFDGKDKHPTRIGRKNLLGSNTVLVAPAVLGDYVKTGAGTVVTAKSKIKSGDVVAGVPARSLKMKKSRGKKS